MYKRVLKPIICSTQPGRDARARAEIEPFTLETPSRSGAVKLEALDHNSARHRWRRALGLPRRGLARRAH